MRISSLFVAGISRFLLSLCLLTVVQVVTPTLAYAGHTVEPRPVPKWIVWTPPYPAKASDYDYASFDALVKGEMARFKAGLSPVWGGTEWNLKTNPEKLPDCEYTTGYTHITVPAVKNSSPDGSIVYWTFLPDSKMQCKYRVRSYWAEVGGYQCPDGYTIGSNDDGERACLLLSSHSIEKGKTQGKPKACVGDPCDPTTGNHFETQVDYRFRGRSALTFTRYYNSLDVKDAHIGAHWRHSYSQHITYHDDATRCQPPVGDDLVFAYTDDKLTQLSLVQGTCVRQHRELAVMTRADGKELNFASPDSDAALRAWDSDSDITGRLYSEHDDNGALTGWIYVNADDSEEHYTADGRLTSIHRRGGDVLTLEYDGSGKLTAVHDARGQRMTLAYDGDDRIAAVNTPAGDTIGYGYDAQNNLSSVTYPDGATRRYRYDNADFPHALTGLVDAKGSRYSHWEYDAQGRTIASQHANGVDHVTLAYGNHVTTVTDARGNVTQYHHDGKLGLPRITALEGQCSQCATDNKAIAYDDNGFVRQRTDFNNNVTRFTHNARGLETSRTEASNTGQARTVSTQWSTDFRLPVQISEPGKTTSYTYDSNGNRLSQTVTDTATGESRTTHWTYNQYGQVLTKDGPRTNVSDVTHYRYDSQGNLSQVTNALGQTVQITDHDANGNPLRLVDANGVVTTLAYDARQRLISRTVAAGTASAATTTFTYDPVGQLTKVTLPNGAWLSYAYDDAHRLVGIQDAQGNHIDYTLDAMGNRVKEQVFAADNSLIRKHSRQYNQLNRLVADINGVGDSTHYEYDANGNRTAAEDAAGNRTAYQYDALDRLSQTTDAKNGVTHYSYDPLDHLTQVIDPRGVTTTYDYDAFGDVLAVHSPDAGTTTYTYDAAGNRVTQTDARGIQSSYTYDALNRLTAIHYPDSSEDIAFTYDEGTYGKGQLTTIVDPSGTTHYSYGPRGNLLSQDQTEGSVTLTTSYSYDAADNLKTMTYPSGMVLSFTRDSMGQITKLSVNINGSVQTVADNIQYQAFGPVKGLTYGNGIQLTKQFDLAGRLAEQTADPVQHLSWSYANTGNITAITDSIHPERSQTFGYDALYRLTQASGAYGDKTYTYDADGNRTQLTTDGNPTTYTYASDSNRLLTAGSDNYVYDANGNTTDNGQFSFAYNQRNRMATATQNGTLIGQYQYNALGQRTKKIVGQSVDYAQLAEEQRQLAAQYQQQADDLTAQAKDLQTQVKTDQRQAKQAQQAAKQLQQQADRLTKQATDAKAQAERFSQRAQRFHGRAEAERAKIKTPPKGFFDRFLNAIHRFYANLFDQLGDYMQRRANDFARIADRDTQQAQDVQSQADDKAEQAETLLAKVDTLQQQVNTLRQQAGGLKDQADQALALADQYDQKASNGGGSTQVATRFAYGKSQQLIGEYDGSGNAAAEYVYLQSAPLAQIRDGQVYYYHTDQLGTPQQITDKEQSVVWDGIYQPFGMVNIAVNSIESALRFPGQFLDQETKLSQNHYRAYSSRLGQYNRPDPSGKLPYAGIYLPDSLPRGGIWQWPLKPTYPYAKSNPISFADPNGLKRVPVYEITIGVQMFWYFGSDHAHAGSQFDNETCANTPGSCGDYHERYHVTWTANASPGCQFENFKTTVVNGDRQWSLMHVEWWQATHTEYIYGSKSGCEKCRLSDYKVKTSESKFPHPGKEGF